MDFGKIKTCLFFNVCYEYKYILVCLSVFDSFCVDDAVVVVVVFARSYFFSNLFFNYFRDSEIVIERERRKRKRVRGRSKREK